MVARRIGVVGIVDLSSAACLLLTAPPALGEGQGELGQEHACAINDKGKAICWGDNDYGKGDEPSGNSEASAPGRPRLRP